MRTVRFSSSGKGCLTPSLDADLPWMQTPWIQTPSPRGQTNTCENITLPQTAFAGGKNKLTCVQQPQQVAAMY